MGRDTPSGAHTHPMPDPSISRQHKAAEAGSAPVAQHGRGQLAEFDLKAVQQVGVPDGVHVPREGALGLLRPVVVTPSTKGGRHCALVHQHGSP